MSEHKPQRWNIRGLARSVFSIATKNLGVRIKMATYVKSIESGAQTDKAVGPPRPLLDTTRRHSAYRGS